MRRTLLVTLLVALLTVAGLAPSAAAAPACPTGWGSLADTAGGLTMSPAPIVGVRAGQQPCFDRVVLDVAGPVGAYRVRYVAQVTGIGSGEPIAVAGGARLLVTVFDPAGAVTMPSVAGFPTLRAVVNAGSFEGVSEFGVGTRARLPFRSFVLPGPGDGSRLVIDVAHRW